MDHSAPNGPTPAASERKIIPTGPQPQGQTSPNDVYVVQKQPAQEDSGSFGWAVLGFFIPLVGLILWLVWKDEKPKCAKSAGIDALVGFILSILLGLMSGCASLLLLV